MSDLSGLPPDRPVRWPWSSLLTLAVVVIGIALAYALYLFIATVRFLFG